TQALARVFIPEPPKPAIQRIETEISLIHAQGDEKSGLVGPYNNLRMSGRPFDWAQGLGGEPVEPLPPSLGLLSSTATADFLCG
ncbi:MAG: hypothetical protein ACYTHM_23505, partial [Planctomycetota bacterium]